MAFPRAWEMLPLQGYGGADTVGHDMDDPLKDCEAEVERLETENQHLRRSAEEFGQLAERLNRALREGRVPGIQEAEGSRRGDP